VAGEGDEKEGDQEVEEDSRPVPFQEEVEE